MEKATLFRFPEDDNDEFINLVDETELCVLGEAVHVRRAAEIPYFGTLHAMVYWGELRCLVFRPQSPRSRVKEIAEWVYKNKKEMRMHLLDDLRYYGNPGLCIPGSSEGTYWFRF